MKRRHFLKGVAGASLAAPFLSSLAPRTARAADSDGPQRLVIFYTHNGCLTNRWFPKRRERRRRRGGADRQDAGAARRPGRQAAVPARPGDVPERARSTATSIRTIRAWGRSSPARRSIRPASHWATGPSLDYGGGDGRWSTPAPRARSCCRSATRSPTSRASSRTRRRRRRTRPRPTRRTSTATLTGLFTGRHADRGRLHGRAGQQHPRLRQG